jgi:hypothetical protein
LRTNLGAARLRRSRALALFVFLSAIGTFASGFTSAASAAVPKASYGYLATFGEEFPTPGQAGYTGVAVGQATGDIFVARHENFDVGIFAPDLAAGGVFLERVNVESNPVSAENIAVDPVDDSLYVTESVFSQGIAKYVSDQGSPPTYTLDPAFSPSFLPALSTPAAVAVDPVTRDLLVVDEPSHQVLRLSAADGSTISSFPVPAEARGIAVGPDRTIYLIVGSGTSVERFSSAGAPQGSLPLPAGNSAQAVAINPQDGRIAVVISLNNQTYLEGFDGAGTELFRSRFPSSIVQSVQGLAWDGGSDRIYGAVGNGQALTFVPVTEAGIDAPVVSDPRLNLAHAVAEVAPAGQATSAHFEYCPATAACAGYPISNQGDPTNPWARGPEHENLVGPEPIEDDLPLSSNLTWQVRAVATTTQANGVVTETTSPTTSFESPLVAPVTTTGDAASVSTASAELTGTIDTIGAQTTYHFEYGPTDAYGSRAPGTGESPAGNGRVPRNVGLTIAGLQPGTTYHYRLVARNAAGETAGLDRTFTTLASAPPARGYEQVTPVDKSGGTVNAVLGFQAKADGSAVSYMLTSAPGDAPSAVLFSRYLSRRGSADWQPWSSTDPPLSTPRTIVETTTHAISSDFTHAMVVSNKVLTPSEPDGPYDGGANIYIEDLQTGTYTFVGANERLASFPLWNGTAREKQFLAGAPDYSWITFLSPVALLPGAPVEALYHWSATEGLTLQSSATGNVQLPNAGTEPSSKWVSDDGSVMFYNLLGGGVYRHELNGATTPVSVVRAGPDTGELVMGKIDAVSSDGRYAFFRSGPLTAEAQAEGGSTYMYRYDSQTEDLVTVGPAVDIVTGHFLGAGDDGRTVFYDSGFFDGTTAWHDGVRHLITTSHPDLNGLGIGYEVFYSPNGRYLAYLEDNGALHLYDAVTETDVCASCLPDGSGGRDVTLPGGVRTASNRTPNVVLNDGTVYFNTATRLLSSDHNGSSDVYSYKEGKLALISPGDGPFTARFGDATPDGSNVFFTTDQALVGQDTDRAIDIYDYRVGGGFPGQSPSPTKPCSGDVCQGPLSLPPAPPPAGSAASPGSGNLPGSSARVSVSGNRTVTGSTAVLKVRVPGAGRIQVSGEGLSRSAVKAKKSGSYRVSVRLGKSSRRELHKEHRLTVGVTVTFTPTTGDASSAKTRVTFRQSKTSRKAVNR